MQSIYPLSHAVSARTAFFLLSRSATHWQPEGCHRHLSYESQEEVTANRLSPGGNPHLSFLVDIILCNQPVVPCPKAYKDL